jgi:hypothetical protein
MIQSGLQNMGIGGGNTASAAPTVPAGNNEGGGMRTPSAGQNIMGGVVKSMGLGKAFGF